MSTGTIAINLNSTTVTGSGTKFKTELSVGDFMFFTAAGFNYTLGVTAIASDTSLTVSAAFTGANVTGAGYTAIPSGAMVGITAQIAADAARGLRAAAFDKQNWQQVLTGTGNVTVHLPDGSSYSGPAWNSLTTSINGKAALTGSSTQKFWVASAEGDANSAVPVSLLKSSISSAIGSLGALASVDKVSRYQLNAETFRTLFACGGVTANNQGAGVFSFNNTPFGYNAQYGICAQFSNQTTETGAAGTGIWQHYLALSTSGDIIYATNVNGTYSARKLYSTSNTTTNSSGALVPASPIIRIVNNVAANTRQDVTGTEGEYSKQSDYGYTNAESEGCVITKTSTGNYLVTGAKSLATDLWQVMDCGNGQGRIVALASATETADGIVVTCYKQVYTLTDGELVVSKGDAIDIPDDTWIDIRVVMPADSVWNKQHQQPANPSMN